MVLKSNYTNRIMIDIGYTSKLIASFGKLHFKSEFTYEGEQEFIKRFHDDELWGTFSLERRIQYRKGMLVHFKKCEGAYSNAFIDYAAALIEFVDLLFDFLNRTEPIFSNEKTVEEMSDDKVQLFRLHAFLYCEIYSIHKEMHLRNIKHTLYEIIINPIFKTLEATNYYQEYKLEAIQKANEKVRRLHQQNPFEGNY